MIPQFPAFKKLELLDKKEVEKYTSIYPPYSDFNFVSMWSWDIKDETQISILHDNLVVRFNDYLTGEPVYSFLGHNKVNDTARLILSVEKNYNPEPKLKYVPEHSIKHLDPKLFKIEEDRDHFDYVYSTEALTHLKGNQFESKRGFVHRFLKKYPNFEIKKIDLTNCDTQKAVFGLNHIWTQNKLIHGKNPKSAAENMALERFFLNAKNFNLVSFGLYVNNALVGFTIDEFVSNTNFVISHFIKGDERIVGVYTILLKKSCEDFYNSGKLLFNYEQDLGLPGLRKAKTLWRPVEFLKKYMVYSA